MALLAVALVVSSASTAALLILRGRLRAERASARAIRAAFEARIWEDQIRDFDQLDSAVRDLRRQGHDVNNALSAALLSSQLFFDATRSRKPAPSALADMAAAAEAMLEALRRLKSLLEHERRSETTTMSGSSLIRPVELLATLRACVERARARHPRTELVVHEPEPDLRETRVSACGGNEGMTRAIDALLDDACAADGERPARRVEVGFSARSEVGVVALEIRDDGPGFSEAELGAPIAAFATTGRGTPGLGLYTAEHIARASGGSLRRENADGAGARVTLYLQADGRGRGAQ